MFAVLLNLLCIVAQCVEYSLGAKIVKINGAAKSGNEKLPEKVMFARSFGQSFGIVMMVGYFMLRVLTHSCALSSLRRRHPRKSSSGYSFFSSFRLPSTVLPPEVANR